MVNKMQEIKNISIKKGNNKMKVILVIIYLFLSLSGLILMKYGGNSGNFSFKSSEILFKINLISLIGFICYIGSFLLFTKIVVMFDLSYIMPLITGVVQILTLIASKLIFKETISSQGIVGAIVIIIGILLMNIKLPFLK